MSIYVEEQLWLPVTVFRSCISLPTKPRFATS